MRAGDADLLAGLSASLLATADAAGVGITVTEITTASLRNIFVSDEAVRILGRPREELLERMPLDNIAPEARPELLLRAEDRRSGRMQGTQALETVIERGDGTRVPIALANSHVELGGRRVTVTFFFDVTGRQQALRALAESEARFRSLVEGANDTVAITKRGRITYANPAAARALGYASPAELVGMSWAELLPPADYATMTERIGAMMREGAELPPREYRGLRKDGGEVILEIASRVLIEGGEPTIIGFGRDVTERKQLQQSLAHTERLAALGTLAAGIAHEINNPLAYASLASEALHDLLARAPLPDGMRAEAGELLRQMRSGADRVAAIVRDLRAFARSDLEEQPEPVSLRAAIEASTRLVGHELKQRARVVADIPATLAIQGTTRALEQILVNLLVNAVQATPRDLQDRPIEVRAHAEGTFGVIEIRDHGVGIRAEDLRRIFDPFFTTKPAGVGTGLGLSVCHSLVAKMGGDLSATSEVGVGTTMRVRLPLAEAMAPTPPRPRSERPIASRVTRVLVVDDEPLITEAVAGLLGPEHQVTCATSGERGLALALADPFDVVLCDLSMPGISGIELFLQLRDAKPAMAARIVFMTGGVTTQRAADFLAGIPNLRLDKPFRMSALLGAIEDALQLPAP